MLTSFEQTVNMIEEGKCLHIGASEEVLNRLPKGNWIGGTTSYFMTKKGGVTSEDKLYVHILDQSINCRIRNYDLDSIGSLTADAFDNGFSLLILPSESKILESYAKEAPSIPHLFLKNVVGWIAGNNLEKQEGRLSKVYNGEKGVSSHEEAVVMHVELPDHLLVSVGIINIFEPDLNGPSLTFDRDSFKQSECLVDGERRNLARFLKESGYDTKLPLVSSYGGSGINVSIKSVEDDKVRFYAPVFKERIYRMAKPIENYSRAFEEKISCKESMDLLFSCNCILNYVYGELEGKKTDPFSGPITFGEIAYQLVNQTLVYLNVIDIGK